MPSIAFAQNDCTAPPYFTNLPSPEAGEKWWPSECREGAKGSADYEFYTGRIALVSDDAVTAERYFRNALAKNPDHVGARVYLGLALVHQGRDGAGAYHYRRALVNDLPVSVSEALQEFVTEETTPLGFGGFGYANINRRSNPFQDSGLTVVQVGEYEVSRIANDDPQTVVEAGGTVYYRHPITEATALYAQLGLSADYYTGTDDLELSFRPRVAFEYNLSKRTRFSAGLQAEQVYFNGERIETGIGPRLSFDYSFSDSAHLWGTYTYQSLERPGDDVRDGHSNEITLGLNRVETPRLVNYYGLSVKRYDYQRERLGYTEARAYVTSQYQFRKGFRGEFFALLGGRKYHGISHIFETTREDLRYSASFAVGNDNIQWRGISPQIRFEYEGRDSNADVYDYDDIGINLEFSRNF